jgi:hypothetical protein
MEALKQVKKKLEYLRAKVRKESMTYGDLVDLELLVKYIEPNDLELLQAAGVFEKK